MLVFTVFNPASDPKLILAVDAFRLVNRRRQAAISPRNETGRTDSRNGAPIITVTGKAYFDVGHAPKDQSNRRSHQPGYAAWEIHPVMKIEAIRN
jgi:hypothetical protein